ncbi:Single-stranded nucleic acid binding protein [Mycena chlorophos]|uniref:Probable RNA-binding protein 18 n=1 Tax=Mycena chlorophos TaxID=658473 RepID=A0A8H6SCL3_MYCCL|nr:Single-stranded nucleic acid binding protein [Mycena chlorophos]
MEQHLTFPTFVPEDDAPVASSSKTAAVPTQSDRLYIGNLHPTVDEYTLLQLFNKHGRVTKLDFLFHKTGVLKGKPRGYAFIEYGDKDDALRAQTALHDRLLRGRKLVVTFAQNAPIDPGKPRKVMAESGRPTTLSMLKSGRREGTDDKIAMMEAKLREMAKEDTKLVPHASLPPKPLPSDAPLVSTDEPQRIRRPSAALPSLPLVHFTAESAGSSAKITSKPKPRKAGGLAGVKLGKPKAKAVDTGGE